MFVINWTDTFLSLNRKYLVPFSITLDCGGWEKVGATVINGLLFSGLGAGIVAAVCIEFGFNGTDAAKEKFYYENADVTIHLPLSLPAGI